MRQYINKFLLLSGCALAFAACDDNSWNDKLDGFEEPRPTDVQSIDYTLTAFDYKTLAANKTNKALAGEEYSRALSAVGTQGYFTDAIPATQYIPALLNDPKFPYFALSDGSVIKVTYRTTAAMPKQLEDMVNAEKYTISEADYQSVWGSEENYTTSFAPSHTAARSIPAILKDKYPSAAADDYIIVNYNTSDTDPDFGTPAPTFELSGVLGSLVKGNPIEVNGYVAAISTQGPIITDKAGSIFAYRVSNNSDLKVGDQVSISTTVDSYNFGYQLKSGATAEVKGSQAVTYPTPKTWSGSEIDAFVASAMASDAAPITPVYSKFTGTVIVSGNYINITLDGTTVQVSPYGATDAVKAALTNGSTVTFEGYVMAIASKGKYLNTVITKVGSQSITTQSAQAVGSSRAMVSVPSVNENAIYRYNGSEWVSAPSTVILSHADYQAMGQRYDNLSGTIPATYLPKFLSMKYPYATTDQQVYVVYYYYNGSATATRCDQYTFDGTAWILNDGVVTETSQFVRSHGSWNFDPSLVITLPPGRGQELSALYFQTCVDWIRDNVADGPAYVSSYGNNEYYCGTSAYQGNIDLRASAAKAQYPGYESMTDDEVIALEKERFANEVMPAALGILHPDMAPVDGIEKVTITLHFGVYSGSTISGPNASAVFRCTAPGTFECESITWP